MFNRLFRTPKLVMVAGVGALAAGAFLIDFLSPIGNPNPLAANLPPTPDIPAPHTTPHPYTPSPAEIESLRRPQGAEGEGSNSRPCERNPYAVPAHISCI